MAPTKFHFQFYCFIMSDIHTTTTTESPTTSEISSPDLSLPCAKSRRINYQYTHESIAKAVLFMHEQRTAKHKTKVDGYKAVARMYNIPKKHCITSTNGICSI